MQRTFQPNRDLRASALPAWAMVTLAWLVVLIAVANAPSFAETRTVTAGEPLRAGALQKWLVGADYRDLWTTPIDVEVLDLRKEAGGLRPEFRVGGFMTPGLAFSAANGRSYTFRSLYKDLGQNLNLDLQEYFIDDVLQDQLAAVHPGGAIVVPPLAKAAGVLQSTPRLVILPDDPALGEFREVFANRLGTFEEYPTPASDKHAGFHGATDIISSTKLWEKLIAGPEDRVDVRAYLRARLFDYYIGDWDRHANQWRWAKIPGKTGWQPIAEDRDFAFVDYEGLMLTLIRPYRLKLLTFREKYPTRTGLTFQGWQNHRWLLPELSKSVWIELAKDVQSRLTDAVIDDAVSHMPPPYQALRGEELARILKARREILPQLAEHVYRFLAAEVDIQATDQSEHIDIRGTEQGGVAVSVAVKTGENREPYFQRHFSPSETKSLRLYLREGNDTIVCHGHVSRQIRIDVIGRATQDALEGCDSTKLRFTEIDEIERRKLPLRPAPSAAQHINLAKTEPPPVWERPRDWRSSIVPIYRLSFGSDLGLLIGGGATITRFAFGKAPFAERHSLSGAYAFGLETFDLGYTGTFQHWNPRLQSNITARISGLEQVRFFGFGNETDDDDQDIDDFFKTEQLQYTFAPSLNYIVSQHLDVFGGSSVIYSSTDDDEDTLLNRLQPYGEGEFGRLSFFAGFDYDTRNRVRIYGPGFHLRVQGSVFPEVWDVEETFGTVEGTMAGYLGLGRRLMLALRVGGKNTFGDFPFQEAAYIGGKDTVRGLDTNRFAGDASVFANGELRFTIGKASAFLFRAEYGLFVFADVGRVFSDDDDDSDKWHPSGGGGFSLSTLERSLLWSLTVARSEEQTSYFIQADFSF